MKGQEERAKLKQHREGDTTDAQRHRYDIARKKKSLRASRPKQEKKTTITKPAAS